MRQLIALSLAILLAAGACGTSATPASPAPGSPAPAGTPGTQAAGTPGTQPAATTPAATPPAGGVATLAAPPPAEIAAALASPIATANAAGNRVIRALVDATGIGANGAALDGPVSDLLAAEHRAATDAFIRLGGDPAKLQAARPSISLASWKPATTNAPPAPAEPTGGALIGGAGLAVGWVQLMMEVDRAGHDDKGFVRANTELEPVTSVNGGLTMTLTQSLGIDLAHCPDPSGLAEGTITWDLTVVAAGTLEGTAVNGSAHASFSISLTATAADDASLAEFTTRTTGDIVAAGSGGGSLSFDGVGIDMGVSGGEPDPSTTTGHGEMSGTLVGADEILKLVARLTAVLAGTNGIAAQRWWGGGHCVRLEADPSLTEKADSKGGADFDIRAVAVVDEADVEGKLTVEPSEGDFSPLEGTTSLTVRGTVANGDAQADAGLSFTSRRGTAKAEVSVEANDYKVDLNFKGMTLTGRKCGGPAGTWKLKIGGQTTLDGFTASWSGSINFRLNDAGTGTYTVNMKLTAKGLPAAITAGLALSGGGKAKFDAEAKMLRILDGTIAGSASATAPNASAFIGLDPKNASSASLPVLVAACGE